MIMYSQQHEPYRQQQPQTYYSAPQQMPQPVATQMRIITRPPFPHGKHIRWSIQSLGLWAVTGYWMAYTWHRFGPTKAVTTGTFG
jgi:hypothetical protein